MNLVELTLTLLEIKTAGSGYLYNCHTRQILLSIMLQLSSTQPRTRHFVIVYHRLHHHYSLLILLPSVDKNIRSRQDSNLCGETPLDFESKA